MSKVSEPKLVRLLITGTRHGWDQGHLERVLQEHYFALCGADEMYSSSRLDRVVLVHGDAPGVDTQAKKIWEGHGLPTEAHPADWLRFGPAAGPIRNTEMVALGAQQCLAFPSPDSRGTHDCARKAREAGIPVFTYYEEK